MSESDEREPSGPAYENSPARLWSRIHEHRMVQWTLAYLAAAYGIQHATVLTSEAFEWPHTVQRITMLLLVLGLPVAVTLAWYQGARASRHFSAGECTIIAILLLIGSTLFYVFVRPTETAVSASQLREASISATSLTSPIASNGSVSLAVMPFDNLSSDKEQEYFSDGMSEEITTALARIPDLRVVARESAFQFKGKHQDLRTVGRALGATHLIEGSVRRSGQQLRISAQLVKSDDGVTVWANSYDRELKDVFAVQEDIAQAIAASLRKPLGLKQGENLVRNRSIDPETYQQYLQARSLVRTRQPLQATNAVELLEKITARDPDYAPAWALLGLAYDVMPQSPAWYSGDATATGKIALDSLSNAESAVRRAIELDPELPDGYASLGRLQVRDGKPLLADASYSKALALDPNNPDALQLYGNLLAEAGKLKDAFAVMQKLRAVEPFVPIYNINAAEVVWLNGQNDAAMTILRSVPQVAARGVDLAEIYASLGRYADAADELLRIPEGTFLPGVIPEAVRLLKSAPVAVSSPAAIPHLGRLSFVYLYVGSPLRALEFHEAAVVSGFIVAVTTAVLWHPSYSPVRKTGRFKQFVRKTGLIEYWRAKGWPPQCHATTGDDFECA